MVRSCSQDNVNKAVRCSSRRCPEDILVAYPAWQQLEAYKRQISATRTAAVGDDEKSTKPLQPNMTVTIVLRKHSTIAPVEGARGVRLGLIGDTQKGGLCF
ncbi:hypothetical protein JTE90_025091 [Oedothorax gibbosus]|uniref:Uncharacterized protein n=1 Tax=Oedothorax gibbosus TaxID=931172 RepID=A0AAV6U2R7_9ARAC|nr:hypothetical protein JTE90_025091 [Oedothorax gibbosus]